MWTIRPSGPVRSNAGSAARPQDLRDHPLAALLSRRKADHLEDYLVLRLGALRTGIADVDAVAKDGAVDADQPLAIALEIGADELLGGSLQDSDDFAARAEISS